VQSGLDAKPTVEALEEERRRLKELERNLAAERDRVQAAAAEEIGQLQRALKEAAERAARREGELEAARKRLERKLQRGRLGRLARRVHARGQSSELSQVEREEALAEREAHLDERERTLRGLAELATAETARLRELGESLRENRAAVETVEALEVRARELTQREAEL
jgi:hypothetical protein